LYGGWDRAARPFVKEDSCTWHFLRPSAVDAIVLFHRRDIFGSNLVLARLEKGNSNNCFFLIIELNQHFKKMATIDFKDVKPFPTLLPVEYSPGLPLNWKCFDVVEFL